MAKKDSEGRNILFVTIFIGFMLLFMLGVVIYISSQVANCSSAKKARKICSIEVYTVELGTKTNKLPWKIKS